VTPAPTARERISARFVDFECLGDAIGEYTAGFDGYISLCRYAFEHTALSEMFFVMVHELGHAAGIRVEGRGADSIMGSEGDAIVGRAGQPIFSDEDRALLAAAQPDFTPSPVCDPILRIDEAAMTWSCECP
jgi:hypothetical protein